MYLSRLSKNPFLGALLFVLLPLAAYAQPSNDGCATPIPLIVTTGTCTSIQYSNVGATTVGTDPLPPCWAPGTLSNTVWFSFVPTGPSVQISTNFANTLTNTQTAVYSGTCGALTLLACNEDINTGTGLLNTLLIVNNLTPGNTYLIMIDGNGAATGDFGVCVENIPPPGPPLPNQDCSGGTFLCGIAPVTVPNGPGGVGAVQEAPTCFGAPGERASNWYRFTAQNNGTLCFSITPAAAIDYDFAVFNVTNGCMGTQLACDWDGTTGTTGLGCANPTGCDPCIPVVAGNTYAILVDRFTAASTAGFTMTFPGSTVIFGPPNPTFTYSASCTGLTVNFTNPGGPGNQYVWNFGDGTTSNAVSPSHTYAAPGNYTVSLTVVENPSGCQASTAQTITVSLPPTVDATANPPAICDGSLDSVQLSAVFSGTIPPPQCNSYDVTTIPFALIPGVANIATGITGDDQTISNFPIGFNFNFFCNNYTTFNLCSNGFLQFTGTSSTFNPTAIPNPGTPNNAIYMSWGDLFPTGGTIRYGVTGTAPNRILVIEYSNVAHCCTPGTNLVTMQGRLYESSNIIEIHVQNQNSTVNRHTVGIENATGTVAFVAPGRNNAFGAYSNIAWRFAPKQPISWAPIATIANPNALVTNVLPTTTTNYTVTITAANGCQYSDNVTVNVATGPNVSATPTHISCFGANDGSVVLNGSVGLAPYQFSDDNITFGPGNTFTGLTPGSHRFYIRDDNGCKDSVDVIINEPAILTASIASQVNVTCNGLSDGSATASATGGTVGAGYSYSWNTVPVQNTITATGLAAGTYTVTVTDANGCQDQETVTITQPTVLVASIASQTNVSCFNGANGTATASASGGTIGAGYSYSWNTVPVQNIITATGLAAGTYTVTVTDANGCQDQETVTITQPTALVASIASQTNVSCFNGSNGTATASATGGTVGAGYSYSWNTVPVQNTITATGLAAGTYTVTVTDANGCQDQETVTITQPTALVASIASQVNVTCNGLSNGSATASATGGTVGAGYSFSWNTVPVQNTITATGLAAGTYTVTVTDANGCQDQENVTITQPTVLVASIASQVNVTCNGLSNGSATASATGGTVGAGYSYSWNTVPVQNTITATGLAAGTYTVTVTDANGCQDQENVTITQPTVLVASIASQTNVSCFNGANGTATASATGGTVGAGYSYSWNTVPVQNTITATGLAAGTYTVTVTDANGCQDQETVTITQPTVLVASIASQTNVSCFNGSNGTATASATGGTVGVGYSYSWNTVPVQNTITATGLAAGTYTVTVTDANGCQDQETVTITQPTVLVASIASQVNVTCNGLSNGTATASATGGTVGAGYSFSWNTVPVQNTITATGLAAGTYTVTVTDANGCQDQENVTITQPTVLVASIASQVNVTCNGLSNGSATASATGGTVGAGYSYSWNTVPVQNTITATGLAAGTYTVTVTDANGCQDQETVTITQPTVLVASIASQTNVSCFNGANGTATASASGGTIGAGYSYSWNTVPVQNTITATGLAAGTYTVTVTDANGCQDQETVTITQPTALVASIASQVNVTCNGLSNGTATASATGGTVGAGYSYSWNTVPVQNTITATGLAAGTYTVTVTDANGCQDQETVTITQPAVLVASIASQVNVTCSGLSNGTATASATGGTVGAGYSYSWNTVPVQNTITATGLAAGTYTVTVTDVNGCSDQETVTITQPSVLTASVTSPTFSGGFNVSCPGGSDGSINLTVAGGTPGAGYQFDWGGGVTTEDRTNLPAGTYSVTVTDANGCQATASITLTQPGVFSSTVTSPTVIGGWNITCNGATDGDVDLTVTGGTIPLTFAWSNGAPTEDLTNVGAGTYTVTVTDDNGCQITNSITLTQPTALSASATATDYNGVEVTCFGATDGEIDLTVTGGTALVDYQYNWGGGITVADPTGLGIGTYTVTVTDDNGCTTTTSITLDGPTDMTASVTATLYNGVNVTCFGATDGEIDLTPSGGTPGAGYTYDWGGGITVQDPTGLAAGSYTVTVTDANGCTETASITLTEPTDLTATSSATDYNGVNVTCFGATDGEIDLTPAGGTPGTGYQYDWGGGITVEDPTGLAAGTYTVTITDANGCTETETISLSEPSDLTASATATDYNGVNVTCFGATDGEIDLTPGGGTPGTGYTFDWGGGIVVEDPTGLAAGTYTVTVTDANGCTETASITLTEPTQLTASFTSPTFIGGNHISCSGASDGSIDVTAADGTPGTGYTYDWGGGITSEDRTGLVAGVYNITVTDANGCQITLSNITLTEPSDLTATITSTTDPACVPANSGIATVLAAGSTPGYTYSWPSGGTLATESNLLPGSYTVTVTDTNGCTETAIAVLNNPSSVIATMTDSVNVSCFGGSDGTATVSATGGDGTYSYAWSPAGGTNATTTGLPIGTYQVVVTDGLFCTDTATVTLEQPDSLILLASHTDETCLGGANGTISLSHLGGVAPYTYSVDGTFSPDSTFTGLEATLYTVSVRDACTQADSIIEVGPGPEVVAAFSTNPVLPAELIIPQSEVVCTNQSQNATSYAWDFGDGGNSTLENPSHQYLVAGEYTITLVVTDGVCSDTATSELVKVIEFTVFIPNVLTPNNDGINDQIQIGGNAMQSVEFFVFDRWGNQVFGEQGQNVVWKPADNVPEGIYAFVVKYTTSEGVTQDRSGTITLLR